MLKPKLGLFRIFAATLFWIAWPSSTAAQETSVVAKTMDRLSAEMMEQMVAAPMALVRSGDVERATAMLEDMVRETRSQSEQASLREADLLTSFGVLIYIEGLDQDNEGLRRASVAYLERAVPAYRAAFGPIHPEVAVALNSLADAMIFLNGDVAPAEAEALLEEALSIMLATRGPRYIGTLGIRKHLAAIRGHPARVNGDPARLADAAATLLSVINDAPETAEAGHESAPMMRLVLARMYAANGEAEKAVSEGNIALAAMKTWSADEQCGRYVSVLNLIDALDEIGDAASRLMITRDQASGALRACAK